MRGKKRIAVITGPTATGKSRIALDLAHRLEDAGMKPLVVSMDSMQVYKHMDVGTDKLMPGEREGVPHHLIDVVEPDRTFSAAEFAKRAGPIIDGAGDDEAVIVAGGTGFYLKALLEGLFPGPEAHADIRERLERDAAELGLDALHKRLSDADPRSGKRIHPADRVRIIRALEVLEVTGEPMSVHFDRQEEREPRYDALIIGLQREREEMYGRIDGRVDEMMEAGLVDEVERLREMGYGPELPSQHAIGYRQVHRMLDRRASREEAVELIKKETRRFAKRQITWFRKQQGLRWMPAEEADEVVAEAAQFLSGNARPGEDG